MSLIQNHSFIQIPNPPENNIQPHTNMCIPAEAKTDSPYPTDFDSDTSGLWIKSIYASNHESSSSKPKKTSSAKHSKTSSKKHNRPPSIKHETPANLCECNDCGFVSKSINLYFDHLFYDENHKAISRNKKLNLDVHVRSQSRYKRDSK
ncbi:hypothetical protein BB558_000095 [Smittium angustum]|uniref:Uncharacterized protein n=1 Tax=Smittium angustum TaxID=133377 RepID=A0A2U1JFE3_SMIAN|nr:hypothetical protein BB558_000095 [Smittium angustum]